MFHRHDHQGIASVAIARIRIGAFFQQDFDGVLTSPNTLISGIKPLITRRRKQRRAEASLFINVSRRKRATARWRMDDT